MSHTKEPWAVDSVMSEAMHDIILDYHAPDGGYPTVVATVCGGDDEFTSLREGEANARRIVACVNACAGLANPAALPELLRRVESMLVCIEESGDDFGTDNPHSVVAVSAAMRECLAKLKGGV